MRLETLKNPIAVYWLTFICVVLLYFASSGFNLITIEVYAHFLIFGALFSLFFYMFLFLFNAINFKSFPTFKYHKILSYLLYFTAFINILIVASNTYNVFSSGNVLSMMEFRTATASPSATSSIGAGLAFPAVLAAWHCSKINGQIFLSRIMLLMAIVIGFLSTTKIFLLLIIFYYFYYSRISARILALYFLMCFVTFSLSHIVLGKFSSNPDDGLLGAILNTFAVYFVGGMSAYQLLLDGAVELHPLSSIFGLKSLSYMFPFVALPESGILPWVRIGQWNTNLYTAFGYWYSGLGTSFLVIAPFCLSAYTAMFFSDSAFGRLFEFYRPFLLFSSFFIFFGDFFLTAFIMHMIYIFYSVLVNFSTRRN